MIVFTYNIANTLYTKKVISRKINTAITNKCNTNTIKAKFQVINKIKIKYNVYII